MIPNVIPTRSPASTVGGPNGAHRGGGDGAVVGPGGTSSVPVGNGKLSDKGVFPFVHGELELAEATGVSVKVLQRTRVKFLKQGEHWDLQAMRVAYTKNGCALVLEKISGRPLDEPGLAAALKKSRLETEPAGPAPVRACITKFYPNPWLMQVKLAGGELVNVRVKETKNLKRGMDVPLRWNERACVYELARRLPRYPGRW